MIFSVTGDWHIRASRPKSRIDNYKETLFEKIAWILAPGNTILQPGDFFDSPMSPYSLTLEIMQLIEPSLDRQLIGTIFGQHDLRYHASRINTPLAILNEAEYLKIVPATGIYLTKHVRIYGCSWGEEIPIMDTPHDFNILLIHRMIVQEKLWETQEGHEFANKLLQTTGFDLIVSGDNHHSFIEHYEDRWLINCGSLMRANIDQKDHKPMIVIFDTEKRTAETVYIPIKPIGEVMDFNEKEVKRNEDLDAYIKGLSEEKEIGLDFLSDLMDTIKKGEWAKEMTALIMELSQ